MRVTLNDGRQMTGQMLAFDKHMNLVLADTEEFRRVKKKPTKGAQSAPGSTAPATAMVESEEKRTLGLTIVRGTHIVSCSVDGPPPADPSARLGTSAPGGTGGAPPTLAAGPGISRPAGRGLPVDFPDFRQEDFQEVHHQGLQDEAGHQEEGHLVLLLHRAFQEHLHKASSLLRAFNHLQGAEGSPHQGSRADKGAVKGISTSAISAINAKIRSQPTLSYFCSTHFWGPISNFGIPIAAILDTQKDPELISGRMTAALTVYAATFMRYSMAVTPKNYLLFACHFLNFGAQSTQGVRFLKYWNYGGREEALKMKAQQTTAQTAKTEAQTILQQGEEKGKSIIQQGETKLKEVRDKVI
ncbi:MAG: hypothetical protein LQ349_007226 [Xanthoria aureola]|nr:MAG: hypothetical protein LQ349_007226 [Xanthoria aureola]